MKKLFCILLVGWMTASVDGIAAAQAGFPANDTIQRWIDQRVSRKPGVGIVLATRNAAGETKVFSAGESGRTGLALNEHTLFEIASITKTFTTALLADMVGREEVKLDDPVSKYLPPSLKPQGRNGKQISLLDLATHTSALPTLPTNIKPRSIANPYADYTVTMFSEFLVKYELPREIGASYEYSAVGLGLLGHALGHRMGTNWETTVVKHVLDPLGMSSTRATLSPALQLRLAPGHGESGDVTSNWDIPALPAMGALKSTAHDMLRFLAANMDSTSRPFGQALSSAHVPRVRMDEETRVGLAWQTGHATNRTLVWHGGGTGGYRSLIAFDPGTRLGIVLLMNSAVGADDIGWHLLDPKLPLEQTEKR